MESSGGDGSSREAGGGCRRKWLYSPQVMEPNLLTKALGRICFDRKEKFSSSQVGFALGRGFGLEGRAVLRE